MGDELHFALWVLNALAPLGAGGVFLLSGCPRDMSMLGALGHFASGCALSCRYFYLYGLCSFSHEELIHTYVVILVLYG